MQLDWPTVKEWGLQVPALGIMFAFGFVCVSAIMTVVFVNLRHNRTVAGDFSDTVKTITESQQNHQKEMRELASEDSQALRECLEETNRTIGRACNVLDWHEKRQRDHEELLRRLTSPIAGACRDL